MKIFFATQNKGKLAETRQILSSFGFAVESINISLAEPDAGTVEEVARIKLEQASGCGYDPIIVDDAGIFFAAYPGFPGVLTKRVFERIGYRGIKKLLSGEDRKAWFEGAVAVRWRGKQQIFTGKTTGIILNEWPDRVEPEPGFPFDPIFIPDGGTKVLKEMTPTERMAYSYRRQALEKMAQWMKEMEKE
jgi:XTP/dITP diphosphohydrolase